ncbi:MAG: sensor histidine kinase [Micromonosporaceae bacterium]|nr:sensor histidine kinase [Micromonosporaceae bacterium]
MPILVIAATAASHLPIAGAVAATGLLWTSILASTAFGMLATPPEHRERLAEMQGTHSVSVVLGFDLIVALLLFFVGRTLWTRRAYAEALEDRARVAEANQHALAVQAVAEERRRVARELHDVVAHHISVMSVLASGARRALARDPAAADEALTTIEQTGRTVLRDMRRLLDLLRADDADPDDRLAPQPGVDTITALIDQVRETGLQVRFTASPGLEGIGPGLALTVYRIIQEGLTNVIKHGGPAATVDVRLTVDRMLDLEIADTGRGPRPDGAQPGHGLLGMRERVALFGGSLRVGPRPGGGYRLRASLPLDHAQGLDHAQDPAADPPLSGSRLPGLDSAR